MDCRFVLHLTQAQIEAENIYISNVSKEGSEAMTAEVCNILENELGIPPDRIYVKYKGYSDWGWNGGNF